MRRRNPPGIIAQISPDDIQMTEVLPPTGNRTALLFANVAHFYSHVMMLIYPTVVIALEVAFERPYGELLSLSFVGFVLYGLAALPAGWLGDKWSAPAMLAVFFFGTGAAGIAAGFATGSLGIVIALGAIGLLSLIHISEPTRPY